MSRERLFYLDFIRAIAILMVIFYHYDLWSQQLISPRVVIGTNNSELLGNIGVSLFFMLSGAGLALSYGKKFSLSSFYSKRFLAIYPLFYLTYLVWFYIRLRLTHVNPFSVLNPFLFLLTVTGLDGLFLYKANNFYIIGEWFLGCIVIIYALFPVVRLLYVRNRYLPAVISAALLILVYFYYDLDMDVFRFPLTRLFEFCIGMLFISLYSNRSFKSDMSMALISIAAITAVWALGWEGNGYIEHIFLGIMVFFLLAPAAGMLGHPAVKRSIAFISTYSYGAFLFHHQFVIIYLQVVRRFVRSPGLNWLFFFCALIIIYLVAFVLTKVTSYGVAFCRKYIPKEPLPIVAD